MAGYEEVVTEAFGRQCFPCPNGTHRPRRRAGGCTWCSAANFETGGRYLGMAQCDCIKGYARSSSSSSSSGSGSGGACQPTTTTTTTTNDDDDASPDWYRRIISIRGTLTGDPALVVLLSIGGAAAALVFTLVLVCVL